MTNALEDSMNAIGVAAAKAARSLSMATGDVKNAALALTASNIDARRSDILGANAAEVTAARASGRNNAFIDRMTLNDARIDDICAALRNIASLDDPIGKTLSHRVRPNGLEISRVAVPIGVIAIIYESRPNVTVDAAAIAVKAGNSVILRGGSECIKTNGSLFACFRDACAAAGLPENAAQFIDTPDRAAVGALLSGLNGNIDLVIPRGGKSLVALVQSDARAPVLSHLDGVCHVYVDRDADAEKAVSIAVNSKMRRTGVCGAAETLLIDTAGIDRLLPPIAKGLRDAGCTLRGDSAVRALYPGADAASDEDFYTEYLDAVISVAAVDGVAGAAAHIARYGSGHTESIVTENAATADTFIAGVDSAIVLHNASTQFADGGEFGLGAEIGIATGRLHARGPVGVEELTTYKNVVRGAGQIRP